MQLLLIPPAPHPTILFSFVLPNFQETLPFPPAYQHQLQVLLSTNLDGPPSPYALDKAVWPIYLMEMVTFDMSAPPSKRTVTVKMIDGSIISWPIEHESLLLEQVMRDVERSGKEAEKEAKKESAYLPLTNSALLSNTTFREEVVSQIEPTVPPSANHRPTHRKSKSLFNSLLSALNITAQFSTSSAEQKQGSIATLPYRIGGGCNSKRAFELDPSESFNQLYRSLSNGSHSMTVIVPTSEFTFPERQQLPLKPIPASKILRRQARSTLVDCFRRWVIPAVKERITWGSFPYSTTEGMMDELEDVIEEASRWGKMSKATNAYIDWACRSMIGRCELALRAAERTLLHQEASLSAANNGMTDKESRRSSASSTFASAISASSRASSSHEQIASMQDGDDTPPVQLILSASQRTPRQSTESRYAPASVRHAATLRHALDRFRCLQDEIAQEARGLADSHTLALRILEERGRRRGWSSSEGGGMRRSPLTEVAFASESTAPSAGVKDTVLRHPTATSLLTRQEFGSSNSVWEMSIPLIRSSLGEISSTWEDWQMEWEMEQEFDSDDEFTPDPDAFPEVVSEFEGPGDNSINSSVDLDLSSQTITSIQKDVGSDTAECHSEFSDSSSDGEGEVSDPSPTSPFGFPSPPSEGPSGLLKEPPSPGTIINAKRSRKTGVEARIGTYEDVRDELPPNPPLMALSPPRRINDNGHVGAGPSPSHDRDAFSRALQNSPRSPPENRSFKGSRPPRPQHINPSRLPSAHRREAATVYPDFAQSRMSDIQAGVFDVWEDDEDAIFGDRTDEGMAFIHQQASSEDQKIGYPPGLHGDFSSPPSPKQSLEEGERPRRTSFYVERQSPPHTLKMLEKSGKSPRSKPSLSLSFPDPPTHKPCTSPNSAPAGVLVFARANSPASIEDVFPSTETHVHSYNVPMSAPPTAPTFIHSVAIDRSSLEQMENGTRQEDEGENAGPALLLDTPTTEPSANPYSWNTTVPVVPKGVVVIGTVGASTSGADRQVYKDGKKITKPLLCVTPPPRPSSLSRSRSWKDQRDDVRVATLKKRRSADDVSEPSSPSVDSPSTSSPLSAVPSLTVSSATSSSSSIDTLTEDDFATEQASLASSSLHMATTSIVAEETPGRPAMDESYPISEAWFLQPARSPTIGLARTKSMSSSSSLKEGKRGKTPPPAKSAKGLKRSLSLTGFAKRIG